MPINMMGTIGAYAKTQKLKMQWDMKKQNKNVTDHKKSIEKPVKETVQEPAKEPVRKPEKDAVRTESPELRKVRRAKAKAAYAHIEHPQDPDAASSVDIKA